MLRTRRLPGFRFEVQAPPPADILPRMDVACFVGFAARGPLHLPVRVTSVPQFELIFGEDILLGWDAIRGEQVYGYLAPAVRAFFRNGGRTAWIIRVAGQAQNSYFPMLGLLELRSNESGEIEEIRPAYAQARSPGSWADSLRVSTSLMSRTVELTPLGFDPPHFLVTLLSPDELVIGDLLRLTFENGSILICSVRSIESIEVSPPQPNRYAVTCDQSVWFQAGWHHRPATQAGRALVFRHDADPTEIEVTVPVGIESPLEIEWPARENPVPIRLELDSTHKPPLGSFLRVDLGAEQLWMRVEGVDMSEITASPLSERVQIRGQGFWWSQTSVVPGEPIDLVERLSFELWARTGEDALLRISDLTFDPRHPRYWSSLPTDLQLYGQERPARPNPQAALWSESTDPRFPLSSEPGPHGTFIPLTMPPLPDLYLGPELPNGDRLTRDGLDVFSETLFLDPDLAQSCVRDLINEADTLRYYAPRPRKLQGIHAVLDLEEVTLIAVPDAVHRGWEHLEAEDPPSALPSTPLQRPEWWHFLDCDPKSVIPATAEPEWGEFLNCDIRVIDPPGLELIQSGGENTFTITWNTREVGMTFLLEEATRPNFADAVEIYSGPEQQFTFYGHTPGVFYYRVRGLVDGQSSDWSNGEEVNVSPFQHWTLQGVSTYSDAALLEIQHSVLRLCAARGDLSAVLSLPEHYRVEEAIAHVHSLTSASSGFCGPEELRTLSFGALYHPWTIGREENLPEEFRRTPPDGAMTGIIARRTLARGAWLAPANELLKGVVALTPSIERRAWQDFQDAQINLIRQEPEGFTVFNNDTLTSDAELRQINVRRLLILLRRLALQLGPTYVFEPNNAALRRSVERGFEAALDDLFQRGAFAGRTAAESYRVVTDDSVNTSRSVDQGRFIVELKVAPSLPLSFITIRLVQTGDRTLIMQEA